MGEAVRHLVPAAAAAGAGRPSVGLPGAGTAVDVDSRADVDARLAVDRRAGWATLGAAVLLPVAPVLAGMALVGAVLGPTMAARRRQARTEARLHDQLPDVVDLLALTAAAGLPVSAALVALGSRPGGPVGVTLARAAALVRRGGTTAEALGVLAAAGPPLRPLVEALAQHDRYGSPLLPALDRVAIEARARRRRRAEEAARRLPVTLLLPLVLTTFPAFVLLTVVPLLAGSLGSLSLPST
ncbi:MAG TPA: type II secretion system F family protein [Acidimicrobiales bacterium]|nr:type II secretion system F family protein [Acidimicrobiales bacterium]